MIEEAIWSTLAVGQVRGAHAHRHLCRLLCVERIVEAAPWVHPQFAATAADHAPRELPTLGCWLKLSGGRWLLWAAGTSCHCPQWAGRSRHGKPWPSVERPLRGARPWFSAARC